MKKRAEAVLALERLVNTWPRVDGPQDGRFQQWLADVAAQLAEVDGTALARFQHLARHMMLPLSSYTLGPIWNEILATIRAAATRGRIVLRDREDKIYGPGEAADLGRDLEKILAAAQKSVFLVEPYADENIFPGYLAKTNSDIEIRLLTKNVSAATLAAAATFAQTRPTFAARKSSRIHDRVIIIDEADCWVLGQSIKDAATTKPTYLLPVVAFSDMRSLYEELWNEGHRL